MLVHAACQVTALTVAAQLGQRPLESFGLEHITLNQAMVVLVPQLIVVLEVDLVKGVVIASPVVATKVVECLLKRDLAVLGEPPQGVVHIEENCRYVTQWRIEN